ncbi:hypothetical protein BDN70DRAFT_712011 [Pholiota conissans]|uniref:Uncharacterized protein n=1 Tax=Pholiota conissans TaxID=109636 RepID=A0A9P5YJD5_9AGAR|nr:hypothetical protein BDN70DRAFT_712011 [Pholiota conissans]
MAHLFNHALSHARGGRVDSSFVTVVHSHLPSHSCLSVFAPPSSLRPPITSVAVSVIAAIVAFAMLSVRERKVTHIPRWRGGRPQAV